MPTSLRPKKPNLLVTLADENYIQQAKQLFSSVYWNAGWDGDYMLLSHDIPEEKLKWFIDKGILIKKCQPLYDKESGIHNYPAVIFDKFYLFTPEFKKWKIIVFLDADIIVRSSLYGLTKTRYIAAVQDYYFSKFDSQIYNPKGALNTNINYNPNAPVFNSGIISFNTKIITPILFGELISLFKKNIAAFKYPDQAVLNLYFFGKWKKLPWIYNIFINLHKYKIPDKIKCITIHFFARMGYPALWEPGNSFYQEWKTNLERAELIDLNKIQKVKKWNIFKIIYYSFLLKIQLHEIYKYKIYNKLKSFPSYRLKSFSQYTINTPDRVIGRIGIFIKKRNSDLYNKLRKIKGGQ